MLLLTCSYFYLRKLSKLIFFENLPVSDIFLVNSDSNEGLTRRFVLYTNNLQVSLLPKTLHIFQINASILCLFGAMAYYFDSRNPIEFCDQYILKSIGSIYSYSCAPLHITQTALKLLLNGKLSRILYKMEKFEHSQNFCGTVVTLDSCQNMFWKAVINISTTSKVRLPKRINNRFFQFGTDFILFTILVNTSSPDCSLVFDNTNIRGLGG